MSIEYAEARVSEFNAMIFDQDIEIAVIGRLQNTISICIGLRNINKAKVYFKAKDLKIVLRGSVVAESQVAVKLVNLLTYHTYYIIIQYYVVEALPQTPPLHCEPAPNAYFSEPINLGRRMQEQI